MGTDELPRILYKIGAGNALMTKEIKLNHKIITIDGPAGSGKSTIATLLAKEIDYYRLDSGALYRVVTHVALNFSKKNQLSIDQIIDKPEFQKLIEHLPLKIFFLNKIQQLFLAGHWLEKELRIPEITQSIKLIADASFVRNWVNQKLREAVQEYNIVVDGRDMGTEVFPEAKVKFYLTADLAERGKRRLHELELLGIKQNIEILIQEIEKRDNEDKNRTFGALKKAEDAIEIDTTNLLPEDILNKLKEYLTCLKMNTLQSDRPKEVSEKIDEKLDQKKSKVNEVLLVDKISKNPQTLTEKNIPIASKPEEDHKMMEKLMNQEEFYISDIQKGYLVKSKVIRKEPLKKPEYILVNLNSKSEGLISIDEFDKIPQAGEEVEAIVISFDQETGLVKLSKKILDVQRTMEMLYESYKQDLPVTGKVKKRLFKGYIIDIEKVEMFLPHSHVGSMLQEQTHNTPKGLVGNIYTYKIIDLDMKHSTGVVSRKKWQDSQNQSHWKNLVNTTEIGAITSGRVLHHIKIGIFVEVKEVIGFLHRSNISWGKQKQKIEELYPVGAIIKIRILDIDQENMKMSLGLKQVTKDPWETIFDHLAVGSKLSGSISYLAKHGVFVDLENDFEGFVPISEISWTRKLNHPSQLLTIGDQVKLQVLDINAKEKKLTLGIKQLQKNPWDDIVENIKVGDICRGKIKYVATYGIFVQITKDIDGLVRVEDISWEEKTVKLIEKYKRNQEISFKIINIDKKNQKISCSVKHLEASPYENIQKKYSKKSLIDGKVLKKTDYGFFVLLLNDKMTGLVHISEISQGQINNIQKGDQIKVTIKNIDLKNERISLSLKGAQYEVAKAEMGKYIGKETSTFTDNPFSKLKDIISKNI